MKPIPGFENLYSATTAGTIYSHRSHKELRDKVHSNGYHVVCLVTKDGLHKDYLVHRLVCLAYHGSPNESQTDVNHIDHNKANNKPENLEWCTRSENMRAAIAFGAMDKQRKAVSKANTKRRKPVVGIDKNGEAWVAYSEYMKLRAENAKLRELVDYMTPIALYAASERERDRMRELERR